MPEVALAGMRAGATAVLGAVALTGAAIAGVEKALTTPDQSAAQALSAASAAASPAPVGTGDAGPDAGAPGRVAPPCAPPVRVCVQLTGSSAWLLGPEPAAGPEAAVDPEQPAAAAVGPVPIRHGRPDSPTPVGVFPIEFKNAAHVHSTTGEPMPFAIFFAGDLALYQAELTEPSAGSVRMPAGFAEAFFNAVAVGDLIQVVP